MCSNCRFHRVIFCSALLLVQIKRCSEMARKLRFFKEQMSKAGISASPIQLNGTQLEFDDLEVF